MLNQKNSKYYQVVELANRRFHNTYHFKVELHVPGVQLFRYPPAWLTQDQITPPADSTLRFKYGQHEKITTSDLIQIYKALGSCEIPKTRIEGRKLHVFIDSEEMLNNFLESVPESSVKAVCFVPATLARNQVIVKQKRLRDMTHRIHLRNGRLNSEDTNRFRNIIKNYQDTLEVPITLQRKLEKNGNAYFYNNYIYTKDSGVITFLSLSMPNLIADIFETVIVD